MGLFGNLVGDAFDKLSDGAGKGIGAVFDVAHVMMKDPVKYGDLPIFIATKAGLGPANATSAITSLPGVDAGLGYLGTAYSKGVARPISTVEQSTGLSMALPAESLLMNVLDGKDNPTLGQAWRNSAKVSPGQASVVSLNRAVSATGAPVSGPTSYLGAQRYGANGDAKFDPWFAMQSGMTDAVISWYADPLVVGGKALKVAREAKTEVRAGDTAALHEDPANLTRRQSNIRNRVDKLIDDTRDIKSPSTLAQMGDFKNNMALASAWAKAPTDVDKRLLMRSAWGDPQAIAEFTTRNEALAVQIRRMNDGLDDLLYQRDASTHSLFNYDEEIADIETELKNSERLKDGLNRITGSESAAQHAVDTGTPLNPDSRGIWGSSPVIPKGMTRRDRARIDQNQFILQDGVGGVPVRVMRSPLDRRPVGRIDFHDAEQGFVELNDMAKRVPGLDPARKEDWLNRWVDAPDDNARRTAAVAIQNDLVRHLATRYHYHPADIEALLHKMHTEGQIQLDSFAQRGYGHDADGTIIKDPLMESQLQNAVVTFDIDTVHQTLKRNASRMSTVRESLGRGFDIGEHGLDFMNDLWKFATLFRGGYVVRNAIDLNLRHVGYMGGLAHASQMMDLFKGGIKRQWSGVEVMAMRHQAGVDLDAARHQLQDYERSFGERHPDVPVHEDPEYLDLLDEVDRLHTAYVAGGEAVGKDLSPVFGQGEIEANGYKVADAQGRTAAEAEFNRKLISGDEMWAGLALAENNRLMNVQRSGDWVTKEGSEPGWLQDYLRVTNHHMRQSEITQRLLAGESPREVATWLRSPEGRALRRRLPHKDGPEALVSQNLANLNHVVPNREMWQVLHERQFTNADVEAMFTDGSRPPINAEQILYSMGRNKAAIAAKRVRDGWFKLMSSTPDNTFGRHPMQRHLYRGRVKQLLRIADPKMEGFITPAQQRILEEQARSYANHEMKTIMFDVSHKSNLAHWSRFVAPFFAAWEDAMVKYGRLIVRDPSLIPHAWQAWTAPNDSAFFETVDQNGNPVPASQSGINDNEFVVLPARFLGKDFSVGSAAIPKSGFNVVLQGDPWWLPGFGPLVQAPVNQYAKDKPSVADSLKYVLPYGTQDSSWKLLLPTVARRLNEGEDTRQYANAKVMILQTEMQNFYLGKRDKPPSEQEINDRAKKLWMLKFATSALSPASVQYKSPYQMYIDAFHNSLDNPKGVGAGIEDFYKKYGDDYYLFTMSLSENRTGIRPSLRADKASMKVKDLIAKHPEYGWFFVGPDNVGEYDRNVYTAQSLRKLSPLSKDTWRGFGDPKAALQKTNAEEGWREYEKMNSTLTAIAVKQGWTGLDDSRAEKLRAIKGQWVSWAGSRKDGPAWGHDWLDDFQSRNDGHVRQFLEAALDATKDKAIAGRHDIKTMATYLHYRDQLRSVLQARDAAGGSASITAQSNADLAKVWSAFTGYLVDKDVVFGDTYSRYLEADDLTAAVS